MFHHFKQTPISLNGQSFISDNIQLSTEISISPKYTIESRVPERESPNSLWVGNLKLNYYITGLDYLKQYIYTNELQPISGNIGGLMFNQGYLSNYSLSIQPNNPILVNANIIFFDQLTGVLNNTSSIIKTGLALRTSDIQINNLTSYTQNILNYLSKASFDYSCNIQPSYNYYDTGTLPTKADNISIEERIISTEIISDNTIFNLPISGENFGITFTFSNPFNTGIYETFGCSGLINSKTLNIGINNPHSHSIKIVQHHVNSNVGLSGATVNANQIVINSTDGSHPFSSKDNSLNYIERISIGDTFLTGYSINRFTSYDQITSPIPLNILDDSLTIQSSYGNFIWPNKLHFTYPTITITGLSQTTGNIGSNIYISGTNFYRISDVLFGGNTQSKFQIIDPQTIIATIPNNGLSNPIIVSSNLRNKSGISSSGFFYQPLILNLSPKTGVWKDTITISGNNFSGVTGVYFNNIPAFSFSLSNNNIITARSPETGRGFSSGYIGIYGTGGYGQSISVYNPIIPIYSFSPLSGQPGTGITIFTKIDTGYMFPSGNGYKVRIGGIDTSFFISGGNSTGALTGTLPSNTNDDYIYIYGPDGNTNYSSSQKFDVIGFPHIDYISPVTFSQYKYFNMLVVGNNFEFFSNKPYFFAISGGISGDMQKYTTTDFNNSLNGLSMLVNNIIITGNTGYYDIIVQNLVGNFTLTSGLLVISPINLVSSASFSNSSTTPFPGGNLQDGNTLSSTSKMTVLGRGNYLSYNQAMYAIDSSTGTVAIIENSDTLHDRWLDINLNPNTNNISTIKINNGLNILPIYYGNGFLIQDAGNLILTNYNYTGSVSIFRGATKVYESQSGILSGLTLIPTGILTGITNIRIFPAVSILKGALSGPNYIGLPIADIQIY